MSDQEKFLLLVRKVHFRTWAEIRADRYYRSRSEYDASLRTMLTEKKKMMIKNIVGPLVIFSWWISLHCSVLQQPCGYPLHFNSILAMSAAGAVQYLWLCHYLMSS